MKRETVYTTKDGTQFKDKNAAFKHELKLTVVSQFEQESDPLFRIAPDAKRLVVAMPQDPIAYRNILSDYIRRANIKSVKPVEQTQHAGAW